MMKKNQTVCSAGFSCYAQVHASAAWEDGMSTAEPRSVVFGWNPESLFPPTVMWSGERADIPAEYASAHSLELPNVLLVPGMVNAHAHLELHKIGPQAMKNTFADWLAYVRANHPYVIGGEKLWRQSLLSGANSSRAAGVVAVGDIVRDSSGLSVLQQAGLYGVSFVERFGLGGEGESESLACVQQGFSEEQNDLLRCGWQPHAPYSCSDRLYRACCESGLPVSTHLSETKEENEFVCTGTGPFTEFLKSINRLPEKLPFEHYEPRTAVDYFLQLAGNAKWLLAHLNYVDAEDCKLLCASAHHLAYCPLASEYFGHSNHPWKKLCEGGMNVALGTDSIVCQPDSVEQPMGLLAPMRFLFARHGGEQTLARQLWQMATVNGACALGLPSTFSTLQSGAASGAVALSYNASCTTSPLVQVLESKVNAVPIEQLLANCRTCARIT